jgi:transcriptional regulator with XRE-family HTH domain
VVGATPLSGPDPTRVTTIDDLVRELALLRSRAARGTRSAKVSLEDLAARVGEPRSTIHAYLTGKRLAPAQVLDRIVIALQATATEQREWAEAWYRVCAYRDATHRPAAAVIAASAVPAAAVLRQLPPAVESFTGRDAELAELDDLLLRPTGTIVALSGTAGVGKTALAVYWAHTRADRFSAGHLYLDLRGYDPDDPMRPGQALARCLRALGVAGCDIPAEVDERAALYRSLLAERQLLVVLDNARDTEQVRELLPGTPASSVLVTSRDSLTGLIARHGGHRVELEVLPAAEASRLLQALVGPESAATERELAELADRCARLPLALRIAAEMLDTTALPVLLAELADETQALDQLDAGEDDRTAIRSVFSWSYKLLDGREALAFRLAGLSPVVDLSANALAALLNTSSGEAHRLLGTLTRSHLLRPSRPGHVMVNRLLRAYAAELTAQADDPAARSAAVGRLCEHYLHTAAHVMETLSSKRPSRRPDLAPTASWAVPLPDIESARAWLEEERANLAAVANRVVCAGYPKQLVRSARLVTHYLDSRSDRADALFMHRVPAPVGRPARPGQEHDRGGGELLAGSSN